LARDYAAKIVGSIEDLQKKLKIVCDRKPLASAIEKCIFDNYPPYEEFNHNINELMKLVTWTNKNVELNSLIAIRSYD